MEKGEFRDLNLIKSIKLDGNQLSVIIDNLFETQKYLTYLGENWNAICVLLLCYPFNQREMAETNHEEGIFYSSKSLAEKKRRMLLSIDERFG